MRNYLRLLYLCIVEKHLGEGGEELTVSKVVKKTTKTTVVSSTEGHIYRSVYWQNHVRLDSSFEICFGSFGQHFKILNMCLCQRRVITTGALRAIKPEATAIMGIIARRPLERNLSV